MVSVSLCFNKKVLVWDCWYNLLQKFCNSDELYVICASLAGSEQNKNNNNKESSETCAVS